MTSMKRSVELEALEDNARVCVRVLKQFEEDLEVRLRKVFEEDLITSVRWRKQFDESVIPSLGIHFAL